MTDEHPNMALLKRLDLGNLAGTGDVFAENFVWHFFNPRLPDVEGDYAGLSGLQTFFEKMGKLTEGTLRSNRFRLTSSATSCSSPTTGTG